VLARFTRSGKLDADFGEQGRVIAPDYGGHCFAQALAVQPDGRIVVAALIRPAGVEDFLVVRFKKNGRPDAGFGEGGKRVLDFGGDDRPSSVLIQENGRIVVAGTAGVADGGDMAVGRLSRDGNLDQSFGNGGSLSVNLGGRDGCGGVAVQDDEKLVFCGSSTLPGGTLRPAVVRVNRKGRLDPFFDDDGIAFVDFGRPAYLTDVLIDDRQRIVVGGAALTADVGDFAVARLKRNGRVDGAFAGDGTVTTDLGANESVTQLLFRPNGRIVAAGTLYLPGPSGDVGVVSYSTSGAPDNSFAGDGQVVTDFGGYEVGAGIALQPKGGYVVAFSSYTTGLMNVARYTGP
jgi:uncharacterized delta-60 repeat protein